ncbi:amino acid adenylation domain-containing protein [Actinoplanes sp. NPDC051470]|uniref:non-ribosomal peptide synthetase/type I polyketide synthase n=1 Tax=Actinoplanes sp. NPDC051470 TaxID=3157224 RepID=UPI003414E60A
MTLTDVLVRAATVAPGQGLVHVGDNDRFTSYAELFADALRIGGGLREAGLRPGDPLLVVADDSVDFLGLFWGAIVAGVVPVPLPPEAQRLAAVRRHLGDPPLAGDTATPGAILMSPRDLRSAHPLSSPVRVRPDDLAFLQFSSGSTGTPKGVELTHANVVANLEQAAHISRVTSTDIAVTWMPYFHDMGLIGTHLVPLHAGCRQIRVSPLAFAKRPELWLRTASRHRATILSAANFALALVNRRVPEEMLDEFDLSSVRLLMVGAEPISPSVWATFASRLRRARLAPDAMKPVYGMAEATVAVACPPLNEIAVPLHLSRAALSRGVALPLPAGPTGNPTVSAAPGDSAGRPGLLPAVSFMDVGYPVPGCELRIVDDTGMVLEDFLVGHIQVRGPNVTRGYHGDRAATAAAFDGDWLRTGDLGFLRGGRLCVTGRDKDVLFIHGRNFHAADLEEVASATPGLGSGPVAVVGVTDPSQGREQVTVFLSAPAVRPDLAGLTALVRARVAEALAYDQVRVEIVPTGAFPRTTSGKLRRQPLRDRLTTTTTPASSAEAPPPTGRTAATAEASLAAGAPLSRAEVESVVRAIWARVLRMPVETIGPEDRFLAIGGSSLAAMEVLAALEDAFGRTLDPATLRDCATVSALADRLLADEADEAVGLTPPPSPQPDLEPARAQAASPPDHIGRREELAVVGMACRFPGADTPEEFWANLVAGRDSVTPVTRWADGGHGAFLADPALFDAGFFGIGEDEARLLDPHARIFLELAHEALERAGYAGPHRTGRRIGVFAAVGESGYPEIVAGALGGAVGGTGAHALTGTLRNLTAARVAHLLDLRGPALAVDTACSSALVALHLARLSLSAGDCDVAVVGGVNLNLTATGEMLLGDARALSPTGRCRAFAVGADGFVPGEGGAVLILTRLADAGDDRVLAVVRGTAVNNDGRSLSLMAPNPSLQREVIADAYRNSGVDPAEVSYVEAHGTGTAVGDPVEARSLAYAFPPRPDGRPRFLGSVKTNIGHLLNAAGMPALVKVILALRHRELPPSLHHDRPSPRFDLAATGFEVVTEHRPWTGALIAGVNGFGFGGTNAHVIVAAHQTDDSREGDRADGPHLLTLSARSGPALRAAASELAVHVRKHPELRTADVCATASSARDDGPYRIALVAGDDLAEQLAAVAPGSPLGRPGRLAFLFGGQGTQRPGQGADLYATAPVFRAVLDEMSAAAGPIAGRTLAEWCIDPTVPVAELARTEVTQPLVVAFGVAQAAQLAAYGVRPGAVAGHSVGELSAAVTAGRLTAVEAVLLAAQRGRLTAALAAPGAMLAVAASVSEIAGLLTRDAAQGAPDGFAAHGVVVAAENGPERVVLAGTLEAIEQVTARLGAHGVVTRRLAVSHAFHSPAMEPITDQLGRLAPPPRATVIPQISTVTGEWGAAFDAPYLAAHAVRPVLFAAAATRLREAGFDTMVEVGGSVTLSSFVREKAKPRAGVRGTAALFAGRDAAGLLTTVGELWSRGVPLDRAGLDTGTRRVDLPTYPFQRRRYWITDPPRPVLSVPAWSETPLPDKTSTRAGDTAPTWPGAGEATVTPGPAGSASREPGDDPAVTVLVADTEAAETAFAAIAAAPTDGFLLIVTSDLWAIGAERPRPGYAVWAGLAMAFADENPRAGVRIVDLCSDDTEEARTAAVEAEKAVPAAGPAEIVAWRAGRRLTRVFVPSDYEEESTADMPAVPRDGSYLIVGGAGAAGAEIARHLARRGRPRLLLAGRSAAPVALLDELRGLGAEAEYRVADVSVAADVAALVAGQDFDVVVQAAGVVRPGSLRTKTAGELAAGLAAKVRGTMLLTRALGERPPLVVALSSISSVRPGLAGALGEYVAGNVFLDAFAAAERAAGRPFVAVNLPALAGAGLAAVHTPRGPANTGDGMLPIGRLPEVLWAAAGLGAHQVMITVAGTRPATAAPTVALGNGLVDGGSSTTGERPGKSLTTGGAPGRTPAGGAARVEVSPGPATSAGNGWGHTALVALVQELLAGPLAREAESIGTDEPFLALGLDSLTAVDMVKELEKRLGRTLSTTLFFEHRTIGELVGHLAGPEATEFPFSPVQRAFVTTGRLYPAVPAYAYVRQTLGGPIDSGRLGRAFAQLERRHPMLRVRFGPDGQYFVAPGSSRGPEWYTVVRSGAEPLASTGEWDASVAELDAELRNRTFDLSREGPIRAVLVVAGEELAHLVVVMHHAAGDGYSIAVLGDELWTIYEGQEPAAPLPVTFADHEARRVPPASADVEYWRASLSEYPRLGLPFDGAAEEEPSAPFGVHQRVLEREIGDRLTAAAWTAGVSVFHLLLAGYVRCLARWSGQESVPVSVARAGRTARLDGIERMVGPFADTLPVLAADVRVGEPAVILAARLRDAWFEAEQHGSVSTVDLARMLEASGAGPRTVSPASFSFARFPGVGQSRTNVLATTAGTASAATRLGLVCFEQHGALHFSWNYPIAVFRHATVARFAEEHLAEIIALAGGEAVRDDVGSPAPASVVERIRQQSRRTPEGAAVMTDGAVLTYREMDVASDRLAGRLVDGGPRRIGLLTSPGADTVIGVVGILKAGAAWVPMDVAHPPARLASQLGRAGVEVVVCDAGTRVAAEALGRRGFTLMDVRVTGATAAAVEDTAADTAYVIFTSGSTGRPKGVAVSHRAMVNYLDWAITAFGYREGDRLAQTASICFDASVRQLLAPLLVGATVVAWDRDTVRDPELLVERLERDRVTVWSSVPTLWERVLTAAERSRADLSGLRWVHVGGEELSPAHVRRWFDLLGPGQRITNLYGPTETTINATWHLIDSRPGDDATRLPIGRPIGGAVVEVIAADGRLCADGEVGELHIGGTGLADGYLDDPEQTRAAFVERDGRRWYRSGDLAARDGDGVLWFRGRADDQVKLHGFRVEPGEVEAVLRQHSAVERVAVRVEGQRLVAWVQSSSADGPSLRAYLTGLLPDYLVPSRFEVVPQLPLTAAGKTDRAALESGPAAPAGASETNAPRTATERLLADLWARRLGVTSVGRDDDFFALGGDSIGVLELFASLAEHRPALPRPTVLYRHRTLAGLAAVIDAAAGPAVDHDVEGRPDGDFPVTLTQRGFLLADAVGAPPTWLAAPRLRGPLDPARFQRAVDVLVERHSMLRTVFPQGARPPVQRELPSVRLVVGHEPRPRPLDEELAAEREHRFDPARWPLVRLRLLRYGPEEHVVLAHAHHLVGDGYSVALLLRELLATYDGEGLAPLRATFRDYVALPADGTPEVVPHDGDPMSTGGTIVTGGLTVSPPGVAALRERALAAGATPFLPVLAAYHRALAAVTGHPDPVIGVAVTGRDHALPDVGRIFGPCATAVAVRPGPGAGLAEVAVAVADARTRRFTAPYGWRYFLTHLDFGALGPLEGQLLRLTWDDTDADLAVPPGTDVLLAVRPVDGGLRLTLRTRFPREQLSHLERELAAALGAPPNAADIGPAMDAENLGASERGGGSGALDAALVGYLPAPGQLTAMAGALPEEVRRLLPGLDRETIRAMLVPDGRPRLLETVDTPLGRSGFVAVPRFADELGHADLARDAAAAVDLAAGHGARTVSLAGMIPAHTGYGEAVSPYLRPGANLTTGHAVTAVAVVRTVLAALAARGRKLGDCVVAVLGVGSIGTSSLTLLLARAAERPAGLILCDLPAAVPRLTEIAASVEVPVEIVTEPRAVQRADVIIAATSSGPHTLDVDQLRPGTILVDDSFPHCFDTARALARMRNHGDVLIVGGGLLDCGETTRRSAPGLPAVTAQLPRTLASCQLESLLHAAQPGLPLVTGPVDPEQAAAYWYALDAAGVRAAPLHLLHERLDLDDDVQPPPTTS